MADPATQSRDKRRRWEMIFDRMQKVDADVMQYARNDPVWSDESCFEPSIGLSRRTVEFEEENEIRLSRSLRVAGKLMTSGALIILHRARHLPTHASLLHRRAVFRALARITATLHPMWGAAEVGLIVCGIAKQRVFHPQGGQDTVMSLARSSMVPAKPQLLPADLYVHEVLAA